MEGLRRAFLSTSTDTRRSVVAALVEMHLLLRGTGAFARYAGELALEPPRIALCDAPQAANFHAAPLARVNPLALSPSHRQRATNRRGLPDRAAAQAAATLHRQGRRRRAVTAQRLLKGALHKSSAPATAARGGIAVCTHSQRTISSDGLLVRARDHVGVALQAQDAAEAHADAHHACASERGGREDNAALGARLDAVPLAPRRHARATTRGRATTRACSQARARVAGRGAPASLVQPRPNVGKRP